MRSNLRRLKSKHFRKGTDEFRQHLGYCAQAMLNRLTSIKETPVQKRELDLWEKTKR